MNVRLQVVGQGIKV